MLQPAYFQKLKELETAMYSKDYDKVEAMLADPQVPVNLKYQQSKKSLCRLLLTTSFERKDSRLLQIFLNCPRIDWLAPTTTRNMLLQQEEFDYQFEEGFQNQMHSVDETLQGPRFDFEEANPGAPSFYYLPNYLTESCPEEAKLVYERIISELVKDADEERIDALLLQTCQEVVPFRLALQYSKNVNVRDKNLNSILHLSCNTEVLQIALELGADIEAQNKDGETPIISSGHYADVSCQKFLLEKGANLNHISRIKTTAFNQCSETLEFMSEIGLTEELFKARHFDKSFSHDGEPILEKILKKYPQYRTIFRENLPLYLCEIPEGYKSAYFKMLTEEEFLVYVKALAKSESSYHLSSCLRRETLLAVKHANELLHEVVQGRFEDVVKDLLKRYNANPNSVIDGKTPLFLFKSKQVMQVLLAHGADLFQKCDGFEFFERDDLFANDWDYSLKTLLKLEDLGVDLFKPGEKTGKSLLQHLDQNRLISCEQDFSIPVQKFTKKFLNAYSKKAAGKIMPIDDNDNTIAHYAAMKQNPTSLDSFQRKVFQGVKIDFWKRIRNKDGKSPYDLILENDLYFDFVHLLKNINEVKKFFGDCAAKRDADVIKKHGGKILLQALQNENFPLAHYLCDEQGVRLDRIIGSSVLADSALSTYKPTDHFFIDRQSFPKECFLELFGRNSTKLMEYFLEKTQDLQPYIDFFCENLERILGICGGCDFEESTKWFLANQRVRALVTTENDGYSLWDKKFFLLFNAPAMIKFLRQVGIDARMLIGCGVRPELPSKWYFVLPASISALKQFGWAIDDFEALDVLQEFRQKCRGFCDTFPAQEAGPKVPRYYELKLDDVVGDKERCECCKKAFRRSDKVELIPCMHLLHFNCVNGGQCPYCMNPSKKPKL